MPWEILPGISARARDGRCSTCGDPQIKGVRSFDTGSFDEFVGEIEICERCIKSAAHELGWVPADKHEAVKDTNRRLGEDNKSLTDRLFELSQANATLASEVVQVQNETAEKIEQARVQAIQETESKYVKKPHQPDPLKPNYNPKKR